MDIKTNLNEGEYKRNMRPIIIGTILVIIVGLAIWGLWLGLDYNKQYNTPSLVGRWISQETGKEVEFTQEGLVNVEGIEAGAYVVKPLGLMTYDIEGHSFEMTYKIEERSLVWSLKGEPEETFERKGL